MGNCVSADSGSHESKVKQRKFEAFRDRFETIEEVQKGLKESGLESSDVILAVDLTKSNEWSGTDSFGGLSLHSTSHATNPYKSVITIICKTLSAFDDDKLFPTFGFGDNLSRDHSLLSFEPRGQPIYTFENVLHAYDRLISSVTLSGPTSFAPVIYNSIRIVRESRGQYHILVIIADGQITPGVCLDQTVAAIFEASQYPLSIIMVGVGDGPWEKMEEFDDCLPDRRFDNFQFVNFTQMSKRAAAQGYTAARWEADFALAALMEIPDQYKCILDLGLLGNCPLNRTIPAVEVLLPEAH